MDQGDQPPPPPPGKRGPTHTRYGSPASHAAANCVPASCRWTMSGSARARSAMRCGTFRGSDPRPLQLDETLGGLRCNCSTAPCCRRSTYKAYASGGLDPEAALRTGCLAVGPLVQPRLGHTPELDDGPRRHLDGDSCGGVEADKEESLPRGPRGRGRGLAYPGCAESSTAGALQPHGIEGLKGARGLVFGV